MSDIFFSYNRKDQAHVRLFAEALSADTEYLQLYPWYATPLGSGA